MSPTSGWIEEAVDRLERDLRQVLVRTVDRVARLEPDDAAPAALGELGSRLGRVLRQLGERRLGPLEHRDASREVERLLLVQPRDTGMRIVGRAECLLRLPLSVVLVRLADVEHGDELAALVGERDTVARRRRLDGQADGQRPRQAVREPHRVEHGLVVLVAHEALERRQRTAGDHVQVGELARGQRHDLERLDVVGPFTRPVDERAAVRRDQLGLGGDAHARHRSRGSGRALRGAAG